ncbi:ceramidase domain-containing protein [Ramlibacter sp. 2FC]|uniref:ceramidase domain-containing protein n=1 Tax=Ramlibacter sp. 2FC TaxID=2502188 RepID=UPI0010FA0F52|nr:ceramidase domain-containing protein [Ramlibacter sp. 2FC]
MITVPYVARLGTLMATAAGLLVLPFLLPTSTQSTSYHDFSDQRSLFGMANFLDVMSNLPFVAIGVSGLVFLSADGRCRSAFRNQTERWPYLLFFLGVALTGAGSSYYHLAPDNARLLWDRLPMTLAFMSLLAATLTERVGPSAGLRLLLPLIAWGVANAGYWQISASLGIENLTPYLVVQYGCITLVLLATALFPSPYTRENDIYVAALWYLLAKVFESFDSLVFTWGGLVSGHSLKHLCAACAVYQVLRTLRMRSRKQSVLHRRA